MDSYGVEPMCRVLRIAPFTWHAHVRRKADPDLRSTRANEDERLSKEIGRVHAKNFGVYGAKKVSRYAQSLRDQLNREGVKVSRDRVARLMARLGLEGVVRGKVVRTTTPDKAAACPFDLVNRQRLASIPPSAASATVTTTPSPRRDRAVQDGGHPLDRAMEVL